MTSVAEWLIVVNAQGMVLTVAGGAPQEWIGSSLDERTEAPADLRRVAAEMRLAVSRAGTRSDNPSTTIALAGQPVRLLMVDAVPVHRVPTDLRRLLQLAIEVMQAQTRAADVSLTLNVADNVPRLLPLDPGKVAWIITALVGNALRFVAHGTRLRPGGAIEVRAAFEAGRNQVTVEVRDNGRGIPADRLPRLLEGVRDEPNASALALNIMRDLVAAHGGLLQIESSTEAGRSGTTIRLAFPCL